MAFGAGGGCARHHLVWRAEGTTVTIGCAHCGHASARLDLSATYTEDLVARAVASSRAGHQRVCKGPSTGGAGTGGSIWDLRVTRR